MSLWQFYFNRLFKCKIIKLIAFTLSGLPHIRFTMLNKVKTAVILPTHDQTQALGMGDLSKGFTVIGQAGIEPGSLTLQISSHSRFYMLCVLFYSRSMKLLISICFLNFPILRLLSIHRQLREIFQLDSLYLF